MPDREWTSTEDRYVGSSSCVHGETPGPWSIAGGILILGATILRTAADARADRKPPDHRPGHAVGRASPD